MRAPKAAKQPFSSDLKGVSDPVVWKPGSTCKTISPWKAVGILLVFSLLSACGGKAAKPVETGRPAKKTRLAKIGYTIQVGAFAQVENAARLTESLRREGLNAYYFVYRTGLYKVRFGDFPLEKAARTEAGRLQSAGVIGEYFIVSPGEYAAAKRDARGEAYLRDEIVKTAESFIGVPYHYGGDSPDEGFDCSGLTMAVYQLNGLDLPRSSKEQYRLGEPVGRNDLARGDLVFFSTNRDGKVSHVGIYVGNDRFIHAPGRGKKVSVDSVSGSYFAKRYTGARTYL
jgi:gamma-D-glutamyl-L-lysine dipeptidyl-peptidase